jgi:hypothetical protein
VAALLVAGVVARLGAADPGAVAAAAALVHVHDPLIALVLGLVVGAPAVLAARRPSTLRGASTGTTAGLANPFSSLLETPVFCPSPCSLS